MSDPGVPIDSAYLRNRVAELGLKQWWLAEQIGVDRKTVLRWLHGHVRAIQADNAAALAAVLGCRVADLERRRDAVDLASADDQRAAAALLASSSLLERLGPVGEWNVIESLVKAVAVPDLPLHVLGTLYNRLCIACWRQSKMDEALGYNEAAFDAATRCGDQALLAGAWASRANLLHWAGRCSAAIGAYRAALALAPFLEPPAIGSLRNNLGASLYEAGDLDGGEQALQEAVVLLRAGGTAMQMSIARVHLAIVALLRGDAGRAQAHGVASGELAARADYRRGAAMAALIEAQVAAMRGDPHGALATLHGGMAAFAAQGIDEGLNHEFAARIQRLAHRADDAVRSADAGLRLCGRFPLQAGALQLERALALRELRDVASARQAAGEAVALFLACGAPLRAARVQSLFGPAVAPDVSPDVP